MLRKISSDQYLFSNHCRSQEIRSLACFMSFAMSPDSYSGEWPLTGNISSIFFNRLSTSHLLQHRNQIPDFAPPPPSLKRIVTTKICLRKPIIRCRRYLVRLFKHSKIMFLGQFIFWWSLDYSKCMKVHLSAVLCILVRYLG